MTAPPVDYFAREAADCLARIQRWRDRGGPEAAADDATADARAAARALRGAAAMAGEGEFAALGAALERATAVAGVGDGVLGAALDAALEAGSGAVRAPRPLDARAAEGVRAAAAVLGAAADALGPDAPAAGATDEAALAPTKAAIVPVRALAFDGDADFVVERAPTPPTTADRRFREASRPLAQAVRRLVAEARAADAEHGAPDAARARTLGADLRAAVADVRELAEGYDVEPAAAFFARREPGAGALEPRTLAAVDAAAAGLLGDVAADAPSAPHAPPNAPSNSAPHAAAPAETAPEPADEPAGAEFRPPTGEALVALLETGISGLGALGELEAGADATASAAAGSDAAPEADGTVAITALLYRGPAAITRARAVRDALRAHPGPPDPALLDELYDLLDLAAAE